MSVLSFQRELRTLLVDDEEIASHRLKNSLSIYPSIKIIGEASDGIMAVELINTLRPELVFLDIQMPGLNGLEVLQQLDYMPMVVFVTAYEEYAIKAFEKNSLDYLLKPITAERLAITVKRIMDKEIGYHDSLKSILSLIQQKAIEPIHSIPVKLGNKINLVPINDVCFFEADDKYVVLHMFGEEKIIDFSLSYLQERLPTAFIRVHRTFLINTLKIKEMHRYFKGTFLFVMDDQKQTKIKSSSSYSKHIRGKLLL